MREGNDNGHNQLCKHFLRGVEKSIMLHCINVIKYNFNAIKKIKPMAPYVFLWKGKNKKRQHAKYRLTFRQKKLNKTIYGISLMKHVQYQEPIPRGKTNGRGGGEEEEGEGERIKEEKTIRRETTLCVERSDAGVRRWMAGASITQRSAQRKWARPNSIRVRKANSWWSSPPGRPVFPPSFSSSSSSSSSFSSSASSISSLTYLSSYFLSGSHFCCRSMFLLALVQFIIKKNHCHINIRFLRFLFFPKFFHMLL